MGTFLYYPFLSYGDNTPVELWHGGTFVSEPVMMYEGGKAILIQNVEGLTLRYLLNRIKDLGYSYIMTVAYHMPRSKGWEGLVFVGSDEEFF